MFECLAEGTLHELLSVFSDFYNMRLQCRTLTCWCVEVRVGGIHEFSSNCVKYWAQTQGRLCCCLLLNPGFCQNKQDMFYQLCYLSVLSCFRCSTRCVNKFNMLSCLQKARVIITLFVLLHGWYNKNSVRNILGSV